MPAKRVFLLGLSWFAIVLATISCHRKEAEAPAITAPTPVMEYVELCPRPGDCRKFSRLVMGTDHLVQSNWVAEGQPEPTDAQAFEVLDEAAKSGINFFDTSPIYVGGVENRLGRWRFSRALPVRRNDFYTQPQLNPDRKLYILSKGGFPFDLYWAKELETGTHSAELRAELQRRGVLPAEAVATPAGKTALQSVPAGTYASRLYGDTEQIATRVAEELGHTLQNLSGDIAVYLMHRDDGDAVAFAAVDRPKTPVKTIMEALSSPVIAENVWAIGWSNWETDRIKQSLGLAQRETALPKPVINSPYFSLFEMSERSIHALGVQVTHPEMMNPDFQKGIKIMPYSPLGGFSILDKPEPRWENAKASARAKFEAGDPYWQNVFPSLFTAANEARWHRVVAFTAEFNRLKGTGYTVDQMMNAYVLAHPRTDLLAIGAITVEQVRRTVGALALSKQLTPQDLEYLYSGTR